MTKQTLVAGTLNNEEFTALLGAYPAPPNEPLLMVLERQPRQVITPEQKESLLHFTPFDATFDTADYTTGRIFHTLGEVRWERHYMPSASPSSQAPQGSHVSLVYTGDSAYCPTLATYQDKDLDVYDPVINAYFLFGKRYDPRQPSRIKVAAQQSLFAEVRIPRLLRYPALQSLAGAERLKLVVCEYTDRDTGSSVAYRFQALIAFDTSQVVQEPQEQELDEDESL